ncbi:hypothetical protein OESDEN_03312 [Oesophagostomum dentatum]|uniref:7TM GPCR serpentine receptor class x (Srx) domain-containing protein n=1 Tax=Oesophagostomum dentatum TaxID=61180 RepID=A0A0B1THK6_OESDE|nr:hypothetical protein OESDEN_03312 [Oesophagostomum dentatum]
MEHIVFSVWDYQLAAGTIFTISFVGCLANWIVATSTQRLPSMQNSFGRLMTSQSTGEAVFCSIFAFYYSPMQQHDLGSVFAKIWHGSPDVL